MSHISYSGYIVPYLYNCPRAHYLRNVVKYKPPIETEEEVTLTLDTETKRDYGIRLHEELSRFLLKEVDECPCPTTLIQEVSKFPSSYVEQEHFFDTSFNPLSEKPRDMDFVSIRPDYYFINNGELFLFDWKFGNSDYSSVKYYGEVEFYICLLSAALPEISQAVGIIHFPSEDYTLPPRHFTLNQIVKLQVKYYELITRILADKICIPKPSKQRCRLCNFRSVDAGGIGGCEFSAV